MNFRRFFQVFCFSVGLSAAQAQAVDSVSPFSASITESLRLTLEKCLVRPYGYEKSGHLVFGHYRSLCSEVLTQGLGAWISLADSADSTQTYELQMIGSDHSDGGDLWDLAVWDDRLHLVLESQRVLTFGDPLEAWVLLTGARPVQQVHEPDLDQLFR